MKIITKILMILALFQPLWIFASESRPNILLIFADDVSPDMFSAYGQQGAAKTPNIDELARRGVQFKTAYATAKCASSRVEIMTGRYATATGVYTNEIWTGDSRDRVYSDNIAFSRILKDAGYATAITGKWHAGNQMPYEAVLAFDEYALWESPKEIAKLKGAPVFDGLMEDKKTTSRYWHPGYVKNGQLMKTSPLDYSLDIEADFIMEFMEKKVQSNKPFFVYWPTVAPHGTRTGMPTNPLRGKPGLLGESREGESRKGKSREGKSREVKTKEAQAENHARFVSLIQYLDTKVGQVIKKITDLGIADNTVIIFLSDNGTAVTAKTRGVERGSHVVHIAAGAGIKQRGMTDELSDLSDITPTLIDYANAWQHVPDGHEFHGKSLMPFYTGEVDTHRDWIYGYAATSQLLRSKNYLLEVVNPIMNMPRGRFYYTGENRFGFGYELVNGDKQHSEQRKRFDDLLKSLPPLTKDHPFWQTKSGKKVWQSLGKKKYREKHLYNHKDYKRYDETYLGG